MLLSVSKTLKQNQKSTLNPFSELQRCNRGHKTGKFARAPPSSATAHVTGHHYFTGRDMKWGWIQFNNYGSEPRAEWTNHSVYKGRVERRVSHGHTGVIAEFGRYCKPGHVIRVDFDSLNIHGPDDLGADGCFDDVVAEFRYTRFGKQNTYRLCGELGTNYWVAQKANL